MRINRRQMIGITGLAGIAGCLNGCRSAPITGRQQLILLPESQEIALGTEAYQELIDENPSSQNMPLIQLVGRVGQRIAKVAGRPDFDWEFRLIADSSPNAFCLPGGKVGVFEGILPVCQNEAGLAVVMAHEVAHALARHGGERMSQTLVSNGAERLLDRLSQKHVPDKAERLMLAYGIATEYGVLLPYNRKQEFEADEIGVTLMARAGYEPNEAPRFWKRFASMNRSDEKPEFLSTHPSDSRRHAQLLALMAEAEQAYSMAVKRYGRGQSIVEATKRTNA